MSCGSGVAVVRDASATGLSLWYPPETLSNYCDLGIRDRPIGARQTEGFFEEHDPKRKWKDVCSASEDLLVLCAQKDSSSFAAPFSLVDDGVKKATEKRLFVYSLSTSSYVLDGLRSEKGESGKFDERMAMVRPFGSATTDTETYDESGDEALVASCSIRGDLLLWDALSGRVKCELKPEKRDALRCLVPIPWTRWVIAGGSRSVDGVTGFDLETGRVVLKIHISKDPDLATFIYALERTTTQYNLLLVPTKQALMAYDVRTVEKSWRIGVKGWVEDVKVATDQNLIVLAECGSFIEGRDLRMPGKLLFQAQPHPKNTNGNEERIIRIGETSFVSVVGNSSLSVPVIAAWNTAGKITGQWSFEGTGDKTRGTGCFFGPRSWELQDRASRSGAEDQKERVAYCVGMLGMSPIVGCLQLQMKMGSAVVVPRSVVGSLTI